MVQKNFVTFSICSRSDDLEAQEEQQNEHSEDVPRHGNVKNLVENFPGEADGENDGELERKAHQAEGFFACAAVLPHRGRALRASNTRSRRSSAGTDGIREKFDGSADNPRASLKSEGRRFTP